MRPLQPLLPMVAGGRRLGSDGHTTKCGEVMLHFYTHPIPVHFVFKSFFKKIFFRPIRYGHLLAQVPNIYNTTGELLPTVIGSEAQSGAE